MRVEEGARLSRAILRRANRGLTKTDFLREVSSVLLDFCDCDAIELRLFEGDLHYRWEAARRPQKTDRFELVQWTVEEDGNVVPAAAEDSDLERLCGHVARRDFDAVQPWFTNNGSFRTGDAWQPMVLNQDAGAGTVAQRLCVGGHYRSLVVTRFFIDDHTIGLLQIKNEQPNCFPPGEVEFCEEVAQTLGLAVADRRAQAALRERIKELTCLYGIARIVEETDRPREETLQRIVRLLPPAWQYPDSTVARITVDGDSHTTAGFRPGKHQLVADIVVAGRHRGAVEVTCLMDAPELAGRPFLKEEESLIRAVAREVAVMVARREAEAEKSKLQSQLIHADRLATIGQLAAGVAHELNEPLGSILGFAQLASRCPDLPEQAAHDTEKIITASLYAREVIKKLMVFARQVPAHTVEVDLNQVIEDGLYFLEARCTKAGIEVIRELAPQLPEITADPAQLKQVLVNLVVNAAQAMPDGGTLTVRTRASDSFVVLAVEDTGTGMTEELVEKAFLPFFTTKEVNEGTGLGLAVVHGIVTSHSGSIDVQSKPGQGTRFEIRLPVRGPEEPQEATEDGVRG
jgi:signal transduction histidine kinase